MECILPGWASSVGMIAMILVAGGSALGVFSWLSGIGKRRHPAITFDDQHSRTLWNSLGVFLGVFIAFPLVALLFLETIRLPLCNAFGSWQSRPDYSFDFDQLQRETEELRRELDAMMSSPRQ